MVQLVRNLVLVVLLVLWLMVQIGQTRSCRAMNDLRSRDTKDLSFCPPGEPCLSGDFVSFCTGEVTLSGDLASFGEENLD